MTNHKILLIIANPLQNKYRNVSRTGLTKINRNLMCLLLTFYTIGVGFHQHLYIEATKQDENKQNIYSSSNFIGDIYGHR